jgi:hypothetical protein
MPELPVIASSPVAFSSADGKYFLIPLNAIYFDTNGVIKADRWPLYVTYKTIIDPVLTELVSDGAIVAGPEPPRKPAFTATAVTPGATGIGVTIDISTVVPNTATPPASTADFTVTETDTYTAIKPADLVDTIGKAANGGAHPGLVFVSSAGAPTLPKANVPGTPYAMAAAKANDPATVDIPDSGGGTAFTLQTRAGGADAVLVTIDIKDVDSGKGVFTVVATWAKTQQAVAMSAVAAAFAYVLDIKPPASGFLAPAGGSIVLSGGSDAVAIDPVKASAVILTK